LQPAIEFRNEMLPTKALHSINFFVILNSRKLLASFLFKLITKIIVIIDSISVIKT